MAGAGRRVVVVGGGHNGLVAAAYLARAGWSVRVLERRGEVGGAAVSEECFPGTGARLSRYSYLVSLLPDRIVAELGLRVQTRSRAVASYTPVERGGRRTGLLVERRPGARTERSFRELTGGGGECAAWCDFYDRMAAMAPVLADSMLRPLLDRKQARKAVAAVAGERTWQQVFEQPLGQTLRETFADDVVRGVAATDGLIGTYTSVDDPELLANRCFLYHVIGNGTGEWRVPVGGMGAVTGELERAARQAGAEISTGVEVVSVAVDGRVGDVVYLDGDGRERTVGADYVLAGVAPSVLDRLRGRDPVGPVPQGSQLKVNMLLTRLPEPRERVSGASAAEAFAGTCHLDESLTELESAYAETVAGRLPARLPGEVYCHSLTDPSILGRPGYQTLTLFGLHLPAGLLADPAVRDEAVRRYLAGLDRHFAEPVADCLATDADGRLCLEVRTPSDLERELAMPGGHIFHTDLSWPFTEAGERGRWGVETDVANLLLCGSGARRGGGVSGIGGHNAAHALLAAG